MFWLLPLLWLPVGVGVRYSVCHPIPQSFRPIALRGIRIARIKIFATDGYGAPDEAWLVAQRLNWGDHNIRRHFFGILQARHG